MDFAKLWEAESVIVAFQNDSFFMVSSVLTVISLGKWHLGIFLAIHGNLFYHYRFGLQERKR